MRMRDYPDEGMNMKFWNDQPPEAGWYDFRRLCRRSTSKAHI
jgi:hypothetical protein